MCMVAPDPENTKYETILIHRIYFQDSVKAVAILIAVACMSFISLFVVNRYNKQSQQV